jgi:replicative DNA helicase
MAVLDSGNPVREEDKTLESAVINRALAQLARETEATILATLPLRIQVHEDKRPNLPDLRVLGPYEDSADVVIFPYQGSHSYPQSGDHRSAEIIVAKNRSGEFGTVRIHFDRQSGRFSDLT